MKDTPVRKFALFGAAGAIGHAVAPELERRGISFRVVGRSRERLEASFGNLAHAEIFPADLADARAAAAAAAGIDTIVYCVGLPYPAHAQHPVLMRATLEGAASAGVARLALVSSVYPYGVPRTARVAETHPRQPETRKGTYRKEQEDLVLEADRQGRLRGLIVRLPDFYGPNADIGLANPIFRAALAAKTANWVGPAGSAHEFVFVPDAGNVIVDVALRDDCYGEAWNYGGPGEISAIDFISRVYRAAGRQPKYRSVSRGMVKMLGWFNPVLRELVEMLYLQETPVILDDSKLAARLGGLRKTSYDEGIRRTLEWMRHGAASR